MKKLLLLTIAAFTALIHAQPVARDITILTQPGQGQVTGSLSQYVNDGQPPYTFIQGPLLINGQAYINADGSFTFDIQNTPAYFHYQVRDRNQQQSNIGAVIIDEAPTPAFGADESQVD